MTAFGSHNPLRNARFPGISQISKIVARVSDILDLNGRRYVNALKVIARLSFWMTIILSFPLEANAQLASNKVENGACQNWTLPVDANGWTVFTRPTTGKIYYVSANDGSDSHDGRSVDRPFKTLARGISALNKDNGKDSWLLLKKGDVFQNEYAKSITVNGLNCTHPLVIGSYDPSQPGVVDPYGNVAITSITCSGGTATATTATAQGWRKGYPYQLVISKELPAGFNGEFSAKITGTNTFAFEVDSCPGASDTLHGIVTLGRPVIEPNVASQNSCGPVDVGAPVGDYLAFVGIHCYGYMLDPTNKAFDKAQLRKDLNGLLSLSPHVWRLIEDNEFNYMEGTSLVLQSGGNRYVIIRRNVFSDTFGNYVAGGQHVNIFENYSFYNDWNPNLAAGMPVSVTAGNPGIIIWPNNPFGGGKNCSIIQLTGLTLPHGIVAGTNYYVVGLTGNSFNIDTSCDGRGLAFDGSSSGVMAYWEGAYNAGYTGAYPQPSIYEHSFYLQNGAELVWHVGHKRDRQCHWV